MITALDVHYTGTTARAAAVQLGDWADEQLVDQWTVEVEGVAAYEPGRFFERELPCLLAVLRARPLPRVIVIDGYVWLDAQGTKGLGARLFDALGGAVPVVGVAKTAYQGSPMAAQVLRGVSVKPLYVTAVGMARDEAEAQVRRLHGTARIPTALAAVDRLARGRLTATCLPRFEP
jgi:deoxyribonuclease V